MNKIISSAILAALLVFSLSGLTLSQHIATMDPDGTNQVSILSIAGGGARWSDDMSSVVFTSVDQMAPLSGTSEIFSMNSDGSNLQQLTDYGNYYGQVSSIFHDPSKIWWIWRGSAGYAEIYSMNLDGSGKTQHTDFHSPQGKQVGPGTIDFCGTKIYYPKQNSSWSPTAEIYSADPTNIMGTEVQLTFNSKRDALSDVASDCSKLLMSRAEASNGYNPPHNIYQLSLDGSGTEVRLTSESGNVYCGSAIYSPDGNWIVYSIHNGAQSDIWVMDVNGGNKLNITNTPGYNEVPSDWQEGKILFNTDGPIEPPIDICQSILISSGPLGGPNSLYMIDETGAETWSCAAIDQAGMAHWSEDLSRIVFLSSNSTTGRGEVFTIDSDCTNLDQKTDLGGEGVGHRNPHFRNEAKVWVVRSLGTGHSELFEIDLNGGPEIQLSDFYSIGKQMTQTDLGTNIIVYVLQNSSSASTAEIYKADIDPVTGYPDWSTQVQLTANGNMDGIPALSSDETKIVFIRSDGSYSPPFNVWVMNVDGSGETKLTNTTGSTYFYAPFWSDDGSRITCTYYDGTQRDVIIMDADGGNLTNITNTPDRDEFTEDWRNACSEVPLLAAIRPDPQSVMFQNTVDPFMDTLFITRTDDGSMDEINPASIVINGNVTPVDVTLLDTHPEFNGEVLQVIFLAAPFLADYGVIWDSFGYPYTVSGSFTNQASFNIVDEIYITGHRSGDANNDGFCNLGDAGYLINYIFFDGPSPILIEAGDANGDGSLNLGDASYIINYIFHKGPTPVHP